MALAASTCVWRFWLIMKSAIFRKVQPVWGKCIHVLWLCAFTQLVKYKCLSKPQRIIVCSPQSAPVVRDPLTGPITYDLRSHLKLPSVSSATQLDSYSSQIVWPVRHGSGSARSTTWTREKDSWGTWTRTSSCIITHDWKFIQNTVLRTLLTTITRYGKLNYDTTSYNVWKGKIWNIRLFCSTPKLPTRRV